MTRIQNWVVQDHCKRGVSSKASGKCSVWAANSSPETSAIHPFPGVRHATVEIPLAGVLPPSCRCCFCCLYLSCCPSGRRQRRFWRTTYDEMLVV